jgi:hypothetical protein
MFRPRQFAGQARGRAHVSACGRIRHLCLHRGLHGGAQLSPRCQTLIARFATFTLGHGLGKRVDVSRSVLTDEQGQQAGDAGITVPLIWRTAASLFAGIQTQQGDYMGLQLRFPDRTGELAG